MNITNRKLDKFMFIGLQSTPVTIQLPAQIGKEGNDDMLKRIFSMLVVVMIIACSASVCAQQIDAEIEMVLGEPVASVNGIQTAIDENPEVVPFLLNDRTLVPIRFIAENLNLQVKWIDAQNSAELTDSQTNIYLTAGEDVAIVNGKSIQLDCPSVIENDRIFVPVRFIAEHFSCHVDWDAFANRIIIKEEHELPTDDPTVQKVFESIENGEAYALYTPMYVEPAHLDNHNINMFAAGELNREIVTLLSIRDRFNHEYSDDEAAQIVSDFLSAGTIDEDSNHYGLKNLKWDFDNGAHFGETATEMRLVDVMTGDEMDTYSKKLFGKGLPKSESRAYSIGYASFFQYSRNSIVIQGYSQMPAIACVLFYNAANDTYLFMRDFSIYLTGLINGDYDQVNAHSELLRATGHNDEISLCVAHGNDYSEYSGGTSRYEGIYRNTYKIEGDSFYWISSSGSNGE